MEKLSSFHHDLQLHYSVVIIGSGYGGSILASRLARAGKQVCLLEKGKEFQSGEFPNNELDILADLQISGLDAHHGPRTGLYHIYLDKDISAFVGCGLGGTSLVNANVSLRADKRVFEGPCWPKAFRDDLSTLMEAGYQQAETMLKPMPYPNEFPVLPKMLALEKSAQALGEAFFRPPINVNFRDGMNHVGVMQHACKLCGDCVTGCNYAAKNTLDMNYLPDAKNHGAVIFTEMEVLYLEQQNRRWIIYYHDLENNQVSESVRYLSADLVVLAAGSLGSTEILLRSQKSGLSISSQTGKHFTGNGDILAFSYNNKDVINGIGLGESFPDHNRPVGPTITGLIDMRQTEFLNDGMVIEEGAIPGGISAFLPKVFALTASMTQHGGNISFSEENVLKNFVYGSCHDAMNHTQTFLVMSHDDGKGKLLLDNDRIQINWPQVGEQALFFKINKTLESASQALEGTFVSNPVWSRLSEQTLVTVHPLGGCVMSDAAEKGVVNHKGQVFCNDTGHSVYDNLYVCDGATIPRPLGVNPLLTISALAERCAAWIARDRSWKIDYALPSSLRRTNKTETVGLVFTETMRGRFSVFAKHNEDNISTEAISVPIEFTLTIQTNNLQKMLLDPRHLASITGHVTIQGLSKKPLMVKKGRFSLFTIDFSRVNTRKMLYQLTLHSVEGGEYLFEGYKLIHNDPDFDIWDDTTTLYVTLHDVNHQTIPYGKGILKILPADFMQQLSSIRILNTNNLMDILSAKARFGQFFAGTLYQVYGGFFAKSSFFNPEAPPREKRKLQVGTPSVYFFTTSDHQQLRLTRYQGGKKGPVMLSHGLGVSSRIFSIDTIEPNLLEYLFAEGYDVWLLDYRASIDLPTANTSFSADEIAQYDYPAAVTRIVEITGRHDIQVIAHCFGATTLCMSMLSGLKGVRSILFSQVAAHIVSPKAARTKAGLYFPSFLKKLGIRSLTAYADAKGNWQQQFFDTVLKNLNLSDNGPCNSAVCRRITFLYGQLYNHAQLNHLTHECLHEMFGLANLKSFEHLALMVRQGHIVNAEGQESYLPHLKRLALPVTFIHGAENNCFFPESTLITYQTLVEKNGSKWYERYLIPNYGHIDCIFGKNAAKDVYPYILQHLERHVLPVRAELTT